MTRIIAFIRHRLFYKRCYVGRNFSSKKRTDFRSALDANDASQGWASLDLALKYFHNSDYQQQQTFKALMVYNPPQNFRGNEWVLDIGCGDGKNCAIISRFVPGGGVLGIDLSKYMLKMARLRFQPQDFPNLNFAVDPTGCFENGGAALQVEHLSASKVMDQDLEMEQILKDTSFKFDLAISMFVFHLVPEPVRVLRNVRSKIKVGGKVIVTVPVTMTQSFLDACNIIADEHQYTKTNTGKPNSDLSGVRVKDEANPVLDANYFKEAVENAGLTMVDIEEVSRTVLFANEMEMVDWCCGTLSANWNIGADISEDYFMRVVERMLHIDPSLKDERSGMITVEFFALQFCAQNLLIT